MNRREFLDAGWQGALVVFGRRVGERLAAAFRPARVRAHLHISGRVQGVSFRASTQVQAQKLGVTGWVRNLQDGRVEAVLQGPKAKVDELIRWCHTGPPSAKVEKVDVAWEPGAEEFSGFDVRY